MSLAKKEEVCSHRLVPRLDELAVGVPIKKRPVFLSDRSVASAIPLSIKPPSPTKTMPVTATGTGRHEEPFFNIANLGTNVITKGKGIPDTQIQDLANTSLTALSMTNGNGMLYNGSSEIPSIADSATRTSVPVDELQRQNFLALDLQLPSRESGKNNNYGSLVKEEKLDQSLSEHHKNVPIASIANEINTSGNSIVGRLPNLDLNILPDPADSLEGLPKMHESGGGLYHHRTIQHQKTQVTPEAAISTISSGLGRNIGRTLNMSNSYGLSHGPADVTLDLQLKPPARPELGINWKGLAPAPELSLSLFGKPMDEPKSQSTPDALFDSGTAGSSKKVSEEAAATLVSDKAPAENIIIPVSCNVNPQNTTSATVSGIEQLPSINLVKKEPEEISRQNILDGAKKANLSERQRVGPVIPCAESKKADSAPQGPRKTGFDLNSDIFTNNIIHNEANVAAVSVPISAESLPDTSNAKAIPAVPEVDKCVKHEESTSGHTTPLMEAKSLPSQSNVTSPSVGLYESSSQPTVSTVCNPPASHIHAHEDARQRSCDANESCGTLPSSSNPTAEPFPFNSLENAVVDGMSQGSAEMDCSDDDGNTVSRIPTTNKPHGEPLGNGPISKDVINSSNLSKELKKEHDSDMQQDCSSMTYKVNVDPIDGDKCIKTKVGVVSHAGQSGLRNEVLVSENSKEKQSLNSDKNTPVNNTDSSIHDAKTAAGSTTDLQKSSALPKSASPKLQPTKQSLKTLDSCLEKTRSPDMKSEMSPNGMQAGSCSENHAKITALKTEHQTESEEVCKHSDLRPRDSVLGEDSELDGASSSQQHSEYSKKSVSEKSEHDKSKPDSCNTSLQNEKDGQLIGANWRELGHAYVNRNERWERFMESEREKNNVECHGGRHASDIMNKRLTNHRGGWRGAGSRGYLRNFRGPRMSNEFADESIGGRRRSFEDEPGHIRGPHRRRQSPPHGCPMREMDIDDWYGREIPDSRLLARGQIEDLPDDMMDDRFFMPHSHRHHGQGDHGFIHRDRSHSPAHRRGGHVRFHRGRSPEAMHRSPPLRRTDRPYLPHRRHNGSHDERGAMQRNVRRCVMEGGEAFEPPLHPTHLAELHTEEELVGRRKYREQRAYRHSPASDEDEMLSYHTEDDMEFAEGLGGAREHNDRFRNRMGHNRARGEQEDAYRHRGGHQGWRDSDSNDRQKRRRY